MNGLTHSAHLIRFKLYAIMKFQIALKADFG